MTLCLIHINHVAGHANKPAIRLIHWRKAIHLQFLHGNRQTQHSLTSAVGGRPPQYAPAPLLPLLAPCAAPPSQPRLQSADRNVAVGSHGQYVSTLTAAVA